MPIADKYLRGDPTRPHNPNMDELNGLKEKWIEPTHEPLWFYRIRGGTKAKEEARSIGYKTEENINLMHKLGINMPKRAEFFKGIGLERESKQIDEIAKYSQKLHDRGMYVSIYIGGTMITDYFYKEKPEAINWARKDQNGDPITYGGYQLNRCFPCLNNPGYKEYTKQVLDLAVNKVKADEIFFDNQILRYEPRSCRCEFCIQHLNETIKKKYTIEECEKRYGVAEYPDASAPIFSQATKPWRLDKIQRPALQDWIDHRTSTVLEFYEEMSNHVKKQKPNTAVGMNIKGIHGHNRAFDHGICHGSYSNKMDYSCIDGYKPGRIGDTINSEFRFYKSSHSNHVSIVDENASDLSTVESQVMGYKRFIDNHGWLGDMDNCSIFTPTTQFMRANKDLYHERTRKYDIAVLRLESSLNYNCAKVHEQIMPFEQSLATEKLPWTIIFDRQINELHNYKVIALPEIQAISEKWMEALDAFVKNGGGLIVTGEACSYDNWYRPYPEGKGLQRWFGHQPKDSYTVKKIGKGQIVYVPEWDVHTKWDISDWFAITKKDLLPLKDRCLFSQTIKDAYGDQAIYFKASGNDFILLEGLELKDEKGIDLHLINYDKENQEPIINIQVYCPKEATEASIEIIQADKDGAPSMKSTQSTNTSYLNFTTQTPEVYSLVKVRFK